MSVYGNQLPSLVKCHRVAEIRAKIDVHMKWSTWIRAQDKNHKSKLTWASDVRITSLHENKTVPRQVTSHKNASKVTAGNTLVNVSTPLKDRFSEAEAEQRRKQKK